MLKNPRRPHRPLEVAMRMRDPFAIRAARAKDIVGAVLVGDSLKSPKMKVSQGGKHDSDSDMVVEEAIDELSELAVNGKTSGNMDNESNSTSTSSSVEKKDMTSKWHDIPSHKRGGGSGAGRPKSAGSGPGKVRSGGASEEVVLLMTNDGFMSAMKTINPNMKKEDIETLFKKGVEEG